MTTVIITRPKSKQQAALEMFEAHGFDVFSAPCFDAMPNPNIKTEWLNQAAQSDVLVVLNSHAIDAVLSKKAGFCVNRNTQVIGIGEAVTAHWQAHFDTPITQADGDSESVISYLKQWQPDNITILTAAGGRELIKAHALESRINCVQLNCYIKQALPLDIPAWQAVLKQDKAILTANSGQLLHHIKSQLPDILWQQLSEKPLITAAPRISKMAAQLGFVDIQTAQSPSNQDMLTAVNQRKSVG